MRYFFILGRTPELSVLEICALAHSEGLTLSNVIVTPFAFMCTTSREIPITQYMARLGGIIKIGVLLQENAIALQKDSTLPFLADILEAVHAQKTERIIFGFSAYTIQQTPKKEKATSSLLFRLGLSLKKLLKELGFSCRLVPCPDNQSFLSSVSVEKNHLLPPNGIEIVFIEYKGLFFLGRTLAVQPFEEYSDRDWNRPYKNMQVGLLPPKLAQIMINLSRCSPSKNHTLLDPFCGFGTILQEAFLMGFSSVYGSDINKQTVSSAKENLTWIAEKKNISLPSECIRVADAMHLSQEFQKTSIDAIVTEPYLGPVIYSGSSVSEKIIRELSFLYTAFLKESFMVLKKNGIIVLALPVWIQKDKKIFLPLDRILFSLPFKNTTLSNDCAQYIKNKTHRGTLLYSRVGQSVGREIIVLKKTL
ncbi:methyltransferase domain-containing protein [Candidatus Uhrbacteria bacterium]|nr:methyltransferase domain-containing protein [Candidatus Uhrbacteria bacterium]